MVTGGSPPQDLVQAKWFPATWLSWGARTLLRLLTLPGKHTLTFQIWQLWGFCWHLFVSISINVYFSTLLCCLKLPVHLHTKGAVLCIAGTCWRPIKYCPQCCLGYTSRRRSWFLLLCGCHLLCSKRKDKILVVMFQKLFGTCRTLSSQFCEDANILSPH